MCSTLVCEHKYSEDMPLRSYEWRCKMREMGFFWISQGHQLVIFEKYITMSNLYKHFKYIFPRKHISVSCMSWYVHMYTTHTHTNLTALFPGVPTWASNRKVKPIWILLKQETAAVASAGPYIQVCTSIQTDNHASTPAVCYFYSRMPFLPHNQQHHSIVYICTNTYTNTHIYIHCESKNKTPNSCNINSISIDRFLKFTLAIQKTAWTTVHNCSNKEKLSQQNAVLVQ